MLDETSCRQLDQPCCQAKINLSASPVSCWKTPCYSWRTQIRWRELFLFVARTGVRMSVEGLQGLQHAVHQSELAPETHADTQRGQAVQGDRTQTYTRSFWRSAHRRACNH